MANRAIKYRLYPTSAQAVLFTKTFGCCRKVYNLMLADKISSYERTGSFGKQTPAQYKNSDIIQTGFNDLTAKIYDSSAEALDKSIEAHKRNH